MKPLEGRVAVVAGATREAGRGIARMLGEAGATVYRTGRGSRGHPSPTGRSETIEETADLVTAAGGKGIAVRVDHAVDAEVAAMAADPKVMTKSGGIYTARALADEYGFTDLDGKRPDHAVLDEAFRKARESGPLAALERNVPHAWQVVRRPRGSL